MATEQKPEKNRRFPQLHHDAPQVPDRLKPNKGVEYGCGDPDCRSCYSPAPDAKHDAPDNT